MTRLMAFAPAAIRLAVALTLTARIAGSVTIGVAGRFALAFCLASGFASPSAADARPAFDTGQIPDPVILLPEGPAQGSVMLFSSGDGWDGGDAAIAARLRSEGAAVVGIDLPRYLAALDREGKDCVYLVADFESLGHQLERATGSTDFHAPIVAGSGQGGALAIDILAQTPADTLGGVVAEDPSDGVQLSTRLCTDQPRSERAGGSVYALPPGGQPAPLTLVLSGSATAENARRLGELSAAGVSLRVAAADGSLSPVYGDAVSGAVRHAAGGDGNAAVVELPTAPRFGTMAIVLSGDGGWRDLDRQIAGILQSNGVPTIGLDSLRWFWSSRTPQQTAAELARLIAVYTAKWGVPNVVLVGYSFGANVLPDAYLAMPPEARARVAQVSLLGIADMADWRITVSGWLGGASPSATPTGPALAKLPPELVQCVHGEAETDSACPSLQGTGVEIVTTKGGHHFDGNYQALAQRILDGFRRREAADATSAAEPQ